jgi:hypothetical protein
MIWALMMKKKKKFCLHNRKKSENAGSRLL